MIARVVSDTAAPKPKDLADSGQPPPEHRRAPHTLRRHDTGRLGHSVDPRMSAAMHPLAAHHLPPLIIAPGESDWLWISGTGKR